MQYIENDRIKVAVADHGAELCGIYDKKRGHEVVWQADPKYWKAIRWDSMDSPEIWISR